MYPTEIESVLQSHPAVREVAVVPVHSDINDEHPLAFVSKVSGKEVRSGSHTGCYFINDSHSSSSEPQLAE